MQAEPEGVRMGTPCPQHKQGAVDASLLGFFGADQFLAEFVAGTKTGKRDWDITTGGANQSGGQVRDFHRLPWGGHEYTPLGAAAGRAARGQDRVDSFLQRQKPT